MYIPPRGSFQQMLQKIAYFALASTADPEGAGRENFSKISSIYPNKPGRGIKTGRKDRPSLSSRPGGFGCVFQFRVPFSGI